MGPDWWEEAYEACAEEYPGWESMSDEQRDQAVSEYMLDRADAARDIARTDAVSETDHE